MADHVRRCPIPQFWASGTEIAARWARVEPWRISRAMPGTRMPKKSITPRKTSAGFSLIRL